MHVEIESKIHATSKTTLSFILSCVNNMLLSQSLIRKYHQADERNSFEFSEAQKRFPIKKYLPKTFFSKKVLFVVI